MSGGRQTQTQELRLPEWVSRGGEQNFRAAQAAAAANPVRAYEGPFAAAMSGNQAQAGQQAAETAGTVGQRDLNMARGMTAAGAMGRVRDVNTRDFTGAGIASQYMNPFLEQVQARTLRSMESDARRNQAEVSDRAQAARAFGGDRHAIMAAEMASDDADRRADFIASSNAAAFDSGRQQFNTDEGRRVAVAQGNQGQDAARFARMLSGGGQAAGIATNASGINAQGILNLLQTGGVAQNTQQLENDLRREDWLRVQDGPLGQYERLAGILSGTPTNRTETTTSRRSMGFADFLGPALSIASMAIPSDRRVKRDVELVGRAPNGLGIYAYRYVWDEVPRVGFMADEVEMVAPEALGPEIAGFQTVNYGHLANMMEAA